MSGVRGSHARVRDSSDGRVGATRAWTAGRTVPGVSRTARGTPEASPRGTEWKGTYVFRAIADVLRQIGSAVATVVTLPFRALARLFGGASGSAHGRRA